jgi:outer membrane lipoprotein-sorting protein
MSQDVNIILQKVKEILNQVNDYEANGRMKTNVIFLKVPVANVKIYYKKPDRLKIKNEKGISFIPKGAVSINLNNLLTGNSYTALDAGFIQSGNSKLRIIKLLPEDENNDVVLSTLYIDENNLVRRSKTTTKENGTYELEMSYGKYAAYGLPEKVLFTFNTKDYQIPKGVTFDFNGGERKTDGKGKPKKGTIEIVFNSYSINKGLPESVFR